MWRKWWSSHPYAVDFALFLLRVTVAFLMMTHGYSKLAGFSERMNTFPDPIRVGHSASLALTIFAEFFCSVFLLLGLFTRIVLVPLIFTMVVVIGIVHAGDPFGDKEHAILFLIPYLTLFLAGPGQYSLDRALKR